MTGALGQGRSPRSIPSQAGRLAVVTGANSGIGFETARALADAGARVIVAARDEGRGRTAAVRIGGGAEYRSLDVADLASVARFAAHMRDDATTIDMLVLNAGVMALPRRQTTVDGFEVQFATNYLGHFALTARLWGLLAPGARIVPLGSVAALRGRIDLDDIMAERRYDPWPAYCRSKLAMVMFAGELARRTPAGGPAAIAAHPGFARTNLIASGPGEDGMRSVALKLFGGLISQSAAAGALPVIRAATDPAARAGDYLGPTGAFELKGPAGRARIPRRARDRDVAAGLWDLSERLTGLSLAP